MRTTVGSTTSSERTAQSTFREAIWTLGTNILARATAAVRWLSTAACCDMDRRMIRLKELSELRVEVKDTQKLNITLKSGEAEVFGAELGLGERLAISGNRLAVFTYTGCTIEVDGQSELLYESRDTPMQYYLNLHHVLDGRRLSAKESGQHGPRVGSTDRGKSTVAKILVNYAVRMGWAPLYVDLDPGQGSISPPGTIAATPVQLPITLEDGYPLEVPLVYFHGHPSPSFNPELYKLQIDNMAAVLEKRATSNPSAVHAGSIINTMGWIEGMGYDFLMHSILSLKVDFVLVLDDDELYKRLDGDIRRTNVEAMPVLLHVPKSSGVESRNKTERSAARARRVRDYFYGVGKNLMPHLQTCSASDLHIFRIDISQGESGRLERPEWFKVTSVKPSNEIFNCLVAVSHARNHDELLYSSVAGFIYIQNVHVDADGEGTITFLAPSHGPLPGKLLLIGTIEILNLS